MFQTFSQMTDKSLVHNRLSEIRAYFDIHHIDAYIVPHSDAFQNEYLPECFKRLEFMTAFTGSWGLAIITKQHAILCVDSRYKIQAPQETDTNLFECICVSDTSLEDILGQDMFDNSKIGYDPTLHTHAQMTRFKQYLSKSELCPLDQNLVDIIMPKNNPEVECNDSEIIIHPLDYAGRTTFEKNQQIQEALQENNAQAAIITLPESLCWLLNLRGNDVPHTPYILSYGILHHNGDLDWFVGKKRISKEIKSYLPDTVSIYDFDDFYTTLRGLKGNIMLDQDHSAEKIYTCLKDNPDTSIINKPDPCLLPKAIKNTTEITATINAHKQDGAAVIRFSCWLTQNQHKNITEIDCVQKLEEFRRNMGRLQEISFDTIAGTGAHGAIVHYRVNEKTNAELRDGDLFLLDSGGQYLDGTTDITRTFAIGEPSPEMIKRYTQVLKGHLAIAMARFPEKTTGAALDPLARSPLWQAGIDYGHGTGHGVGLYLSVHEGPQSISSRSNIPLKSGMILSNEPGYYKEGAFGIRIENLEVVTPAKQIDDGEIPMMGFETLTLVPYERKLIDKSLLSSDEIDHINTYYKKILLHIMPLMTTDIEREYLEYMCKVL